MRLLWIVVVFAACSAKQTTGGDDAEECSGSATRCTGQTFERCEDGVFVTAETCASACVSGVGCLQCDPAVQQTCNGNDVVTCNADGSFGPPIESCAAGKACMAGTCQNSCTADGVDLVYVVDEENHFMSFDPRLLPADPFRMIGTLNCPTNGATLQLPAGAITPFSMSVDRTGKAWVEYTTGQIFNVSLTTAACTATAYTPNAGSMALFGMGFVSDSAGSMMEKLHIVGGGRSAEPMGRLRYVDVNAGNYTPQGTGMVTAASDYSPELTGTNEGRLYGFYPVLTSGPAYVQEIDKTTGAPICQKYNLGTTGLGNQIRDWAFAQWGNKFYIFITTQDSNGVRNSTVRSIDKASGAYKIELSNLPYYIPGAGVSTCAPSVIL
jgi:hypothetical protein